MTALRNLCRKKYRATKTLLQAKRRHKQKIKCLKSVLKDVEKKGLLDTETTVLLENSVGCCQELINRRSSKQKNEKISKTYPLKLKAFALTLHFLSPKAYDYIKNVFDTALPHSRTIRKWYQSVDGSPLQALHLKHSTH